MAKLEFHVPQVLLHAFENGEINAVSFVNTIINADKGSRDIILAQLVSYHNNAGSAPHIDTFNITNVDYEKGQNHGKLHINYHVNRFYGCADFRTSESDHEKWPFILDSNNQKLVINAPNFDLLSPNEEF